MPIPAKKVKIRLNQATPTKLTPEDLQAQLANIGLTCQAANKDSLAEYITEVKRQFSTGVVQAYGIKIPQLVKNEFQGMAIQAGLQDASTVGNWEPDNTAEGYAPELSYIQFPTHFDYLLRNKPGFTGVKNEQPAFQGKFDTIQAIKDLFVKIGTVASSTLIKGLDKDAIEAVLSNVIAPLDDTQAADYDKTDSRVIFLVDNYDPVAQEADGIGVLTINWHLTIKNYKKKKEGLKHDTNLTITARSVLYSDLAVLTADQAFVESHFKENQFKSLGLVALGIPVKPSKVTIFPSLPPANKDTFNQGLPKIAKEGSVEVIILYSPDLDDIGSLDNSNSDASSTYSRSVTKGFTFSSSQSLSTEFTFEASAEVVKAGFKIGLNFTFTEQWETSTTETIEFSVPAGKKAFTYQGYVRSAILRFDPENNSYVYDEVGKLLTNIVTTTRSPIETAP